MPSWKCTLLYFAPLLLTLLHGIGVETATLIIKPPVSVNASLGSVVTFTCEGSVEGDRQLDWFVMGGNANTQIEDSVGNMSTIRIAAIERNDHVKVVCGILDRFTLLNESEPAILRVQGLLDPPDNLSVIKMDSDVIILTWNAPPTLDLTDIHPDISHYTVYINNSTHFWSDNVTQPQYSFTGEEGMLNPCSTYSVSVSAWNVVGEGNRSSSVEGYFISIPSAVQEVTSEEVYFSQGTTPKISASLEFEDGNFSSCPGSQPDAILALVNCDFRHPCRQQFEYNPLYSSTATLTVTSTHNCSIPLNTFCTIGFSTVNGATSELPKPNTTAPFFKISTHDVQGVDVMTSNAGVTVVCHFARGSQARGCLVYLTSTDQQYTHTCYLRVDRKQQSNSSVTVEGVPLDLSIVAFNLSVFDIEKDNNVAGSSAYQHPNVISLPKSQSGVSDLQCTSIKLEDANDNDSEEDNSGVIIGSVLGVVLLVLVAVTTAIIVSSTAVCIIRKRKNKRKKASVPGLEPTENMSYEMVATFNLQQQVRVNDMKPCPAYVECTPRR